MTNGLTLARSGNEWKDWKWQQRNSIHSANQIKRFFPNFPEEELTQIGKYDKQRKWGITPYTLSLMKMDDKGDPLPSDPIVKQTFPIRGFRLDFSEDSYDGSTESNWELPRDMVTPIMQHKYTNKVIIRTQNSCLGYCGFCFEVARVEDKTTTKKSVNETIWNQSMRYIEEHQEIAEVILSGGDPLLLDNNSLDGRLSDIRSIPHVKAIRVHTRALTFNPFRIDDGLVGLFKRYRVNALGIHICHPNELTEEMKEAVNRFDNLGYGSIIKLGQTPLLNGINNDAEILKELFMRMYTEFHIKPYYLFHSIPWSPSANDYRTSVKEGVILMKALKRHIPNVAMPEYVIVHHEGKQTVPLEEDETSRFQYAQNERGKPIVRFKNWRGNLETYLDSPKER